MQKAQQSDYFRQERRDIEAVIPDNVMKILDVGCGEGLLGKRLLGKGAEEVVGVEITPDICKIARGNLTDVICGNIEEIDLPFEEGYFDCIIFADVLEHMKEPLSLLKRLRKNLSTTGVVVASIPNVGYYGILHMLSQGHWTYQAAGILDKTHLRFFTRKEIGSLFADAGLEITGMTANIDPHYDRLSDPCSEEITFGRVTLRDLKPDEIQDLFVVQYIIRAHNAGNELYQVDKTVTAAVESGDFEKAKKTMERYLELHPVDADILSRHAELCLKLGYDDDAADGLRKMRIFYPERDDTMRLTEAINGKGTGDLSQGERELRQDNGPSDREDNKNLKKIAIVRGANLNKWEMQNYELLLESYDITAYTTSRTYFDIDKIRFPVVRLPYQSRGLLLHMERLEQCLADKDIVYSADITYEFSAQAVRAKRKYGTKVVCLQWENIPFNYEEHEAIRDIKEMVRNEADHFIAVTGRAKEALMLEGVAEEKISVIPMGIDLHTFRPRKEDIARDRECIGISSEETVVLFIGRMVWEKGIYDLLHSAAQICRGGLINDHRVRFLIVGKGQEHEGVRKRAAWLGISDRVTFLEQYPYEDMHKLHNLADIFVLPSIATPTWQEQFGMVLIESMACGTPVISTLSGSIPEVVGDCGLLIQPNDHLSLYRAMTQLIINKEHREDLGSRALIRAESEFDSRKIAQRVKRVFEKLLTGKAAEAV